MRTLKLVSLLTVIATFGSYGWAQGSATSLRGTVTDQSNAAIAKAKVVLRNPERSTLTTAISGPSGDYEFIQVAAGTYGVQVGVADFRKYEHNGVQLVVNNPATINGGLQVGTVEETV